MGQMHLVASSLENLCGQGSQLCRVRLREPRARPTPSQPQSSTCGRCVAEQILCLPEQWRASWYMHGTWIPSRRVRLRQGVPDWQ